MTTNPTYDPTSDPTSPTSQTTDPTDFPTITTSSYWNLTEFEERRGGIITCTPGQDCLIACHGYSACEESKIFCPEYNICDIQCSDAFSCKNVCYFFILSIDINTDLI